MPSDVAFSADDESLSAYQTYPSRDQRAIRRNATTSTSESAAIADVLTVAVAVGEGQIRLDGVPPSSMAAVKKIADQLRSFSALPKNWNSYNALLISEASLENAAEIAFGALLSFGAEPQISPMSDGGVSLVLLRGDSECEIEVVGRSASVLISRLNDQGEYQNISVAGAKMLLRDWLAK
jgi:hypothetical protein